MSFSDDIGKWNNKVEEAATKIFRGTSLSLFSKIVLRTPVGNPSIWKHPKAPKGYTGGRLRANWQVNINSAPTGLVEGKDENGGKTINGAVNEIFRAKLGDSIYFINNLPYADIVENGRHSKQAPQGMVKVTVAEFKQVVRANS